MINVLFHGLLRLCTYISVTGISVSVHIEVLKAVLNEVSGLKNIAVTLIKK